MYRQTVKFPASLLVLLAFLISAMPQGALAQTSAAAAKQAADYSKQLETIEAKIDARRKELGIPGVSLVIVKDDKVIYIKGLGYKDYEKQLPVTPDTQFAIGSATKAFTALSVLMSMDEGKLALDDSPKKYLPYFKMYDPDTDAHITIRDLMSHRSGLNRTDLAMITGKLTRSELIQVAAQAKPTAKLGEKFQYQNIMFTAAGEIVATVQKMPWEKFIPQRVFKPLGMTNSSMSIADMQKASDFSYGYNYNFDTKTVQRLPFREITQVAPAGSINSSARDMAEWLRFVLNGGAVAGKRLVSEKGYAEWLKPQMKIAGTTSYGFGWFLQDWNGLKVVQHGGNIDGFNSMVAMIPEKHLGFALLTNVSDSTLGGDAMLAIWNALASDPNSATPKLPVAAMEKLVGKYHLAEASIDIDVRIDGPDLVMIVPGQPQYTLVMSGPRQFKPVGAPDGFSVKFSPEQGDVAEMELTQPNRVSKLTRVGSTPTAPVASAANGTGSDAKALVGKYLTAGGSGSITIKAESDGTVTFNIAGQQPYALTPKTANVYAMSPLPDSYYLTPKRDAAGKVTSVVVTQPEGNFEFTLTAPDQKPAIAVDELMQKTINAAGGEAALRKITSRETLADLDMENQGVQAHVHSYAKAPNRSATETTMTALGKPIATGWEYFDGTAGEEVYSFAPAEKYSGKRLDDIRLGSDFYAPLNWRTAFKKIEVTGTAKVDGEDAYIVAFEPGKGTAYREYYSTKTFLLLKREGVIPSSTSAQLIPYSVTYSDYRDVDGVKLPFHQVTNSLANGSIVTSVRSVKQNVAIDDKIFAPRKVQ
jgi:CubicO group peptidase (beta-lactamase class C family)